MSDAASRERAERQHWAVPGSRHDRLVRWMKLGLPIVGLILLLFLLIAPFGRHNEVSFILDKKKVDDAPERMRVEAARYTGADDKGQRFAIVADHAVQKSSDVPIVAIQGMRADLQLAKGPLRIVAQNGAYDLDRQTVAVTGPVRVAGPDGYRLETRDVTVDLKRRTVVGTGGINGAMRLGQFSAGSVRADLGERKVVLDGRARLKIVQGAVR